MLLYTKYVATYIKLMINDIEALGDPEETKATVSSETKLDADASELGSKAVQEILETEGMHKNLHSYLCIYIS